MPRIKYVGPFDEVEVLGRVVKRNHQFEVTDEQAGHPPVARWADAQAELVDAITAVDHHRAAKLRDELSTLDMGEGLLAQVENFQPVTAGKTKDGDK